MERIYLSRVVFLTLMMVLVLLSGGKAFAENKKSLELNTAMMRNTYKIEGGGKFGTCFLVEKPLKNDPSRARYIIVTAAHVLEDIKSEEATIYLRKKQSDNSFIKSPYQIKIRQGSNILWTKNKSGYDVAVMYISLPDDIDYQLLSIIFIADDKMLKEYEIHPGDEMLCLGFPLYLEANNAGFPILRSGRVASYPLVPTQNEESFLLDFEIFPGNSGGPVYFVESNRTYAGSAHIGTTIQFVTGLVSEQFGLEETIKSINETRTTYHPLALANIIHASHILETINQLPEEE